MATSRSVSHPGWCGKARVRPNQLRLRRPYEPDDATNLGTFDGPSSYLDHTPGLSAHLCWIRFQRHLVSRSPRRRGCSRSAHGRRLEAIELQGPQDTAYALRHASGDGNAQYGRSGLSDRPTDHALAEDSHPEHCVANHVHAGDLGHTAGNSLGSCVAERAR